MHNNYDISSSLKIFEKIKDTTSLKFFGNPVLRIKCKRVKDSEFKGDEVSRIAQELIENIIKYRDITQTGRGIAANQIGFNKRIICVWFNDKPEIFINPSITSSEGKGSYCETCMSSGGMITGEVIRPWKCNFEYYDLKGEKYYREADEKQTRILLHEIDHLNGVICLDKYVPKTAKYIFGGSEEIFSFPFKKLEE